MSCKIKHSSLKLLLALSGLIGIFISPFMMNKLRVQSLLSGNEVANAASVSSRAVLTNYHRAGRETGQRSIDISKNGIGSVYSEAILVTPQMMRSFKSPKLSASERSQIIKNFNKPRQWPSKIERLKKLATERSIRGAKNNVLVGKNIHPSPEDSLPNGGKQKQVSKGRSSRFAYTATTCQGPASNGLTPADPHGAVGAGSYVTVSNSFINVYSKLPSPCTLRKSTSIERFFLQPFGAMADPRVIYDKASNRWVVIAIKKISTVSNLNELDVAVSQTEDPAGNYRIYKADINFDNELTTPDYPMIGLSKNYLLITVDRLTSTRSKFGNIVYTPKSTLYSGTTTFKVISSLSGKRLMRTIAPPVVKDNFEPLYSNFLATNSDFPLTGGFSNNLILYKVDPARNSISGDSISGILPYEQPPSAEQLGTIYRLDPFGAVFQGASVQLATNLWNVHTTGKRYPGTTNPPFVSELRYYRIDTNTRSLRDSEAVHIGSTLDYDLHPAIDADELRRPWITWINTGRAKRATLYYDTCSTSIDVCTFLKDKYAFTSTTYYDNGGVEFPASFGDYSSISIDPFNLTKFYVFGQWINSTNRWSSKFTSVQYR